MARQRTDDYWRDRVGAISENEPRLGPSPIAKRVEQEAARLGRDDAPSERTVARLLREHRAKDQRMRSLYSEVHWPQSFDPGPLPWEAAASAVELLQFQRSMGLQRPLVRLALWFWRITLVSSDAPLGMRWCAARQMYLWETLGSDSDSGLATQVESYLAARPWRSEQAKNAYERACSTAGQEPFGKRVPPLLIPVTDPDVLATFAAVVAGGEMRNQESQAVERHV
jgi:hypothetical protein